MLPRNEGVRPEENTFHFIYGTRREKEWWGGMLNKKKNLRNHSNNFLGSRRVLGETLILDCRETVNTNF